MAAASSYLGEQVVSLWQRLKKRLSRSASLRNAMALEHIDRRMEFWRGVERNAPTKVLKAVAFARISELKEVRRILA